MTRGPLPIAVLPGEGPLEIWGRRCISIGLYTVLGATLWLGAPVWLLLAALVDLFTGAVGKLSRSRCILFFMLYLGCELWGVAAAALLWLRFLGGRRGTHADYIEANAVLQRRWSGALFWGAMRVFSMRVQIDGAAAATPAPFILCVRHGATADAVLAAAVVANPNRILLRYVLKRGLLWDPCLDIVGRRLSNAFVDRSGSEREREIATVAQLTADLDAHSGVLIYPEGTIFSPHKYDAALARLRAGGKTDLVTVATSLRHVLPPRLGGVLALIDAAPQLDLVVLMHTGFEGASRFWRFWNGELVGGRVQVQLRRIKAADIPASGRGVWFYRLWAEIDAWIDARLSDDQPRVSSAALRSSSIGSAPSQIEK